MNLERWHRNLVEQGPGGLADYLACVLFFPLSILFGLVAKVRLTLYRRQVFTPYRPPIPVISVGNLAVGGTGKTPVTDSLLKYLLGKGLKVAVVSRGYGRTGSAPLVVVSSGAGPEVAPDSGGDEPVLLARRNPEAVVIVSSRRKDAIQKAVVDFGAEIILLDDGFQHMQVARDLDIVLLDAESPFCNGYPLPFGRLREFPGAVDRADVIVLTRSRQHEELAIGDKPLFRVGYRLSESAVHADGTTTSLSALAPGRIGAFAGIARPKAFFASLEEAGITPTETVDFPDHVVYSTAERTLLYGLASRCDVLLTTEKDLVKLSDLKLPCECLAVPLELDFEGDGRQLETIVDNVLNRHKELCMLDEKLLEILACPKCKGEVSYDRQQGQVVCSPCQLAYPVRDGIPVMLVDEAVKID